ncbi:tetratricopeptide repeat protein [Actinomyces sp. Marseille-P3109]|uniref:tetratricopeptide repeat protein n=1 Tax=Actinomyces sp. Marseille-P3109 TaxID=2083009 RepID=UPI000D553C27|nr:hypothetical protein [Actinomyces sp. Marseille-P3109]
MTTREDILERLAYADALGDGPKASALVAEAVSWADALGDEDLRVATRLALTEAYQRGNEEWKALAPFVWNLARYQRRPELFDDAQVRTLHWHFKRAVAVAGANPKVSKDKVRQLEASLEEFYRAEGASMHVVHGERASVAGLLGLEEEASEELAAWRATHRDENADCEGCDPMRQVAFAYRTEAWELAVATAVPVLTGAVDCSVQPQTMQSLVLLPLLASGRPRAAWEAHLRSYREIRRSPKALISLSYHLEYLALVGRVDRGLDILRRHLSWLAQAESAYVLLSALRGMSLVLREAERAGRGEEALGVELPPADLWYPLPGLAASTTISRAYAEMTGWARRLAQQFDLRNGNSTISDHLERSLARAAFDAAPGAVHGLGVEVDLLEPSEELPEPAQTSLTMDEDGEAPDVASLLGLVTDDDGSVQEHAPRTTSSGHQEAGGRRSRAATSHQGGDEPFPLVDLVRPRPVRSGEEAVRRYVDHRRSIGSSTMDYWYVVDQVATRDLLPPPGEEIPGLEYHTGLLRAAALTCRIEMDEAIAERLRIRPLIELAFGPLGASYVDLLNLDNEITADSIAERSQEAERDQRLRRATAIVGQIEARVEDLVSTELLDPGGTDALVLAADALLVGASVLTDLHARDEALGAIQVVARAAAAVPEDRHAERMDDILDMARAEVLAECGDVYSGCLLAEEVMRRHEMVSPVLAARGRRLLGISSMEVGQFDEAITQFREQANIMLAAGITLYAVASLLSLGSALEASERYLESAEVLESALSLAQRAGAESIALYLHRLLAQTGMAMGEEESIAEHSLAAARILKDQGRRALAGEYLSHAAMAASNLKDNVRAAALFRQAADLEDARTDQGLLDRGRALRRSARALVDDLTLPMARTRIAEAQEIMDEARQAFAGVADTEGYSSAWEIGDWHDDMAWILWRTGQNRQAVEHCEAAYEGYMDTEDRDSASRALCMLARLHAERGEREEALAASARVRDLLGEPQWDGHDALEFVASIEETLR